MIYNLSRNNAFDSSKAKKDLGYTTRPFQETIRDEIAGLKEIGKLQGTNTVNTVSFNAVSYTHLNGRMIVILYNKLFHLT